MRELVDIIEQLPLTVQQWADILTVVGVVGGIVFVVWVIGGALGDLFSFLFKRPTQKLRKGKHR